MALTVDVRMMIVEAGIVANCVSSNAASATLSNRIATEAALAWDKLETDVTVSFSPFEAGLVLDGLSRSQDNLTGDIGDRLLRAINKLMADNDIQPLPSDFPVIGEPVIGEQPVGDQPAEGDGQDPGALTPLPEQPAEAEEAPVAPEASEPVEGEGEASDEGLEGTQGETEGA